MTPDLFANDSQNWFIPGPARRRRLPAAHGTRTTPASRLERIGFELGLDHARFGIAPPRAHALEASPLQRGWCAGVARFGEHTIAPRPAVRQWLQLRVHAWLRGLNVELLQVTPSHLKQIEVSVCPILREALVQGGERGLAPSVNRVRDDAGYAAGNLAVLSQRAHLAKAAHRCADAMAIARRLETEALACGTGALTCDGLTAAQWRRVAVLSSLVEPMAHERACELPLLVLPPNRLRLFNPAQALQAFISRQLLGEGWSQRINALESLLPGEAARHAFRSFFQTLLPRVLEAGRHADAQQLRWAIEDAWGHESVLQRWTRFVRQLTAAQCEQLVAQAASAQLSPQGLRIEHHDSALSTEGWCLDTRGHVPADAACDTPRAAASNGELTLH